MATLRSTLRLRDGFSNTLNNYNNGLRRSCERQEQLNNRMRAGSDASGRLASGIKNLVRAYAGLQGLSKIVSLSDQMASAKARLNLINDGLQTTAELQDKIYNAAQRSRGAYTDMLNTVAKLGATAGDAFKSNNEMIAFAEQLNKSFVVGGASATEQAAAMYQLTQAMGSGRLQGDEYRSIIENAPLLAKAIEDYMRNVEGAKGTMKDWASEGLLTADVIKAAVFSAADATNEAFEAIPMTWAQVWTSIQNKFIRYTQPILSLISLIANNWELIRPIVLTLIGLMGLYLIKTYALTAATAAWSAIQTVATALAAGGFISVLAIIGLVIGAIYLVVAAYNKLTGSSISATGVIVGSIYFVAACFQWMFAVIGNVGSGIWEAIKAICENIRIAFFNSIASVKAFLYDLLSTAFGVITQIAEGLNKLPFVNIDVSGLQSRADNYAAKAAEARNSKQKYVDVNAAFDKGASRFELNDPSQAYKKGYAKGSNLFGGLGETLKNAWDNGIGENTKKTAANTAKTADAVSATNEDLKWLRTLAEREVVNKFTTAEIKVDMGGISQTVNSNMDLDGVAEYMRSTIEEQMAVAAEGTHI